MNKYLEKIASFDDEQIEKAAIFKTVGKALISGGKAVGGKNPGEISRGIRRFGASVASGKGAGRAVLGGAAASTAAFAAGRMSKD